MKQINKLLVVVVLFSTLGIAQSNKPAQTATDIYHVHFNKSAIGKAAELGQQLSTANSNAPMPGHFIVLRHQEGDDWDYCVIEHLGNKATVDASPGTMSAAQRDLSAWHGDTFVSGPSWAEFAKSIGIDQSDKTSKSVYIVSVYRSAPGHRDQMEKMLRNTATTSKIPTGNIVLQHLEGGPWNFMTVTRYNSWQDLAADRSAPANADGWNETREHTAMHHDTIADRIAPK
jgi:hypothetical protein